MANFEIYKSSAGSGKTYTLVLRYLSLALKEPGYFRHILAITFTNKAANEMKQRVVSSLLHLSDPVKYQDMPAVRFMLADLEKETGLDAKEISARAGSQLRMLLHDYDNFAVSTIDSFVTKIIRSFAHDLYLPADFAIETDQERLLVEAVDRLLSRAGLDDELTRVLVEFTESKSEDEKDWRIENDLKEIAGELFREESYGPVKQLKEIPLTRYRELSAGIRRFTKSFENELAGYAKKALDVIRDNGIDPDWLFQKKSGIAGFFARFADKQISIEPNSYVKKTIEENCWYSKSTAPEIQRAINSVSERLREQYMLISNRLQQHGPTYFLLDMVGRVLYQSAVLGEIEKELEQVKTDKNLLMISEFNRLITDIVVREPVPFIYERIGEKFRHYLVDEFQDTSELQWKNLLPLIANSLAGGHKNLVVGDGKQAIYRFRNGQVDQFRVLPGIPGHFEKDVFGEADNALRTNSMIAFLDRNFRSKPAVVEFNNRFFRFVADSFPGKIGQIYEGLEQASASSPQRGFVSLEWFPGKKEEFAIANLDRITELIIYLTDEIGYRRRDIVVLAGKNEQGSLIARHLTGKGIDVISSESLLLNSSCEVNLLVSAFRWLVDPGNAIHASAIAGFLAGLKKISLPHEKAFGQCLEKGLVRFLNESGFDFSPLRLQSLTVYDQAEELIRIFGIGGDTANPYIQFFLDFISKLVSSDTIQTTDLLEAWDEKSDKLSITSPEGTDAVRIMTIHKAKGLEFPVVIYSFAVSDDKFGKKRLWVKLENQELQGLPVALLSTGKNLEAVGYGSQFQDEREKTLLDAVNLVYVAMTRPIDRLYVLTKEVEPKDDDRSVQGMFMKFAAKADGNGFVLKDHRLEFGLDVPLEKQSEPEPDTSILTGKWVSESWKDRILITAKTPADWDVMLPERSGAWGNLVHSALAEMITTDEIDAIVNKMVSNRILMPEKEDELKRKLLAVTSHPLLEKFFSEKAHVRAEAEILLPDGGIIRPDRVIIADDEAVIIDYKTGIPSPHHVIQLQEYASVMHKMGYERIRKLLVYIDKDVLVEEV